MSPFETPGEQGSSRLNSLLALSGLNANQRFSEQSPASPPPQAQQQQPSLSVPLSEPEPDHDLLDYGLDALKGIESGAVAAVQETGQFLYDVASAAPRWATNTLSDSGTAGDEWLPDKMPGYDGLESIKLKPVCLLPSADVNVDRGG